MQIERKFNRLNRLYPLNQFTQFNCMNRTILIIIGIAGAIITAAGIMWYNNLDSPAVIATRKQLYDKDPGVRSQAMWSLVCAFHDKKSIPEIRRLLTEDKNKRVLIAAINNLGFYGDREAIPEIRKHLDNKDDSMRYAAIYALGDLDDKESILQIRGMLNVEQVHLAVIYALGKLNDKESIPELRRFINNNETCTRNTAICALSRLGDKELIPIARKFLNTDDTEMPTRLTSLDALAELDDKESIPRIKELLKDEYEWMRKMAEEALKKLGVTDEEIQKAKEK